MNRRAALSPWVVFLAIFLLSMPLLVLGSLSNTRLMPGLPLSARMFVCTATVAFGVAYRTGGWAGMRALLGRTFDAYRPKPWMWYLVGVLVLPAVLVLEYVIMRVAHMPLPSPQWHTHAGR